MSRKYIDCRDQPQKGKKKCTIAIAADTEKELIEAVMLHAVTVHGIKDSPEIRKHIRGAIKIGSPP